MIKKILIIVIFLAEFSVAFAGNPIIVIRCRVAIDDVEEARVDLGSTDPTPAEAECFGGELNVSVDEAACDNPDPAADIIKLTLTRADGLPWVPNDDAVTINALNNCNLLNNTNGVLTTLDELAGDRGAFVADAAGVVEIQFTRDPTQDTEIVLRSAFATSFDASGANPQIIRILACPAIADAVPTMGEWSVIVLSLMMLILGLVAMKHKSGTLIPIKERVKK